MYELIGVKVRGFRGFTDEKEFVFDRPVVLMFGDNHFGKSSILNAIEWCLFGDDCIGKKTGIRERIGWEIVNRSPSITDAKVIAEFKGDNGIYVITRRCSKGQRRVSGEVSVEMPNGEKLNGGDAENLISVLFRTSFRDFMATVYQHQEAIRANLTDEPKERNEAIDRLLGLSVYRELLVGTSATELVRTQKNMEKDVENFRRRAEQSIHTLDKLMEDEKVKAVEQGIKEKDLTEHEALRCSVEIGDAVVSLAQELGVTDLGVAVPKTLNEIKDFREWVKDKTNELWVKAPDVIEHESLARELQKLASIKGKYDTIKREAKEAQGVWDEFVDKYGDEAKIMKACEEIGGEIGELEEKIRKSNAKAKLVSEGIRYLRDVVKDFERERCPLCGANAPELLDKLERDWEKTIEKEVKELETKKELMKSEHQKLNSLLNQLERRGKDLGEANSTVKACVEEIADSLGREIKEEEDPSAIMVLRHEQIAMELKLKGEVIAEKRGKISNIYDQLARLRTINEILDLEQRKAVVELIWDTDEFAELEKLRDEASQFVEDIASINRTLAAASREEAKTKINAAGAALSEYFCCIVNHPSIPGLVIEVTEDTRGGLNSYTFKSKDGNDPIPILSQGDFNCLAISLFLGLAEATKETQRFTFIMMDDPTQSLGPNPKGPIVKILNDIAGQRKLIIATPDNEFKNLIMTGVTKSKKVYEFLDWNDKDGPIISLTT